MSWAEINFITNSIIGLVLILLKILSEYCEILEIFCRINLIHKIKKLDIFLSIIIRYFDFLDIKFRFFWQSVQKINQKLY